MDLDARTGTTTAPIRHVRDAKGDLEESALQDLLAATNALPTPTATKLETALSAGKVCVPLRVGDLVSTTLSATPHVAGNASKGAAHCPTVDFHVKAKQTVSLDLASNALVEPVVDRAKLCAHEVQTAAQTQVVQCVLRGLADLRLAVRHVFTQLTAAAPPRVATAASTVPAAITRPLLAVVGNRSVASNAYLRSMKLKLSFEVNTSIINLLSNSATPQT